jgi:Mrp family chromosome partitioning ATPase
MSTGIPGLFLLPNRATKKNISRSLYSPRFLSIIKALQPRYDMILIDSPPMLHLADARVMATMAHGVILVLRSGLTNEENALQAHRRVQEDGLKLLGTVLNDWSPSKSELKRHYYYYVDRGED